MCHTDPLVGRVGLWFELEMDWPPQPLHSCAPDTYTYVSNLQAISDTRWRSVTGRAVKCTVLPIGWRHVSLWSGGEGHKGMLVLVEVMSTVSVWPSDGSRRQDRRIASGVSKGPTEQVVLSSCRENAVRTNNTGLDLAPPRVGSEGRSFNKVPEEAFEPGQLCSGRIRMITGTFLPLQNGPCVLAQPNHREIGFLRQMNYTINKNPPSIPGLIGPRVLMDASWPTWLIARCLDVLVRSCRGSSHQPRWAVFWSGLVWSWACFTKKSLTRVNYCHVSHHGWREVRPTLRNLHPHFPPKPNPINRGWVLRLFQLLRNAAESCREALADF
ncbi:hypothetical protein TIFTF001_028493 [Ficus carica]|uniref:Uncharacterized protein n=1 Tax=Ficus carica TaxID=3494 RepID=A0AA88J1T9_FICCA|nr:hypothetical protein TIFTF001_028493 [Ficus carica]